MFPAPVEKSSAGVQLAYKLALPVALLLWLLPLLAIFMTSIRPLSDINTGNVFGIPSDFAMVENYSQVFAQTDAWQYFINTMVITLPTVAVSIALACLTGYALAVYQFKWALPMFFLFVAGNFVPFQILMLPVIDLSNKMEIYNTVPGLVMFHAAFQTGFCTLFMRNFIKALPRELIESARIEGVGEFRIFWHLVLPLVKPAVAALAVLIFTFIWNDFFWATVMLQDDARLPITVGIRSLNGEFVQQWHLISAASLLAAVPPVAMFFLMQKHFIAGLTLGATKG
ncbi:carbohydrate ABC transporter permease [Pararhizobium sp. IMCC21322]|uniref:carbohydrate ABC transporter permease n=1 Tax=Pararhizobium sp. IMCC21322 TaxID=3067903 RepID=UPI0027407289|nr:carbohydrate ABC transporter permease [Pararhizobium sp. IMCC21322]